MEKRLLNEGEIKDILSIFNDFPPRSKTSSVIHKIKKDIGDQLKAVRIYPCLIPSLKKELKLLYAKSIIPPGENVGVIAAQSLGENFTQMTLNSFHSTGINIQSVTAGVPRIIELLNVTENPKTPSCTVYFNPPANSISDLRNKMKYNLVEINLKYLTLKEEICYQPEDEWWYDAFQQLFRPIKRNTNGSLLSWCVKFHLDLSKLFEFRIPLHILARRIENRFEHLQVAYSPLSSGQIDVWVDCQHVRISREMQLKLDKARVYINNDNKIYFYIRDVVLPALLDEPLFGIKGIKSAFPVRTSSGEWVAKTEGSNLADILVLQGVDFTRTFSDFPQENMRILGIEAARTSLIREFNTVISMDGSYVDKRHILLLVDAMTNAGVLSAISRHGIDKEQVGVLSKASFEENLSNFIKAAEQGDLEPMQSSSANIMMGKYIRSGTGSFDLLMNESMLKDIKQPSEQREQLIEV